MSQDELLSARKVLPLLAQLQPLPDTNAHSGHTDGALPGNEQLHQVQVATGGCSVQGCPALTVAGIDLGPRL